MASSTSSEASKRPPPRPKKPAALSLIGQSNTLPTGFGTSLPANVNHEPKSGPTKGLPKTNGAASNHTAEQQDQKSSTPNGHASVVPGSKKDKSNGITSYASDSKPSSANEDTHAGSESKGGSISGDESATSGTTEGDAAEDEESTEGKTPKPEVVLTGVGRTITDAEGKQVLIDEAEWISGPMVARPKYALRAYRANGKEKVSIESRFLQGLLNKFLKRADSPHVTKGDTISFSAPMIPLYFYYEDMIKAASEMESVSESNQKDLDKLKYWYERWYAPSHTQIRETINEGWVVYEDLWALFKPGELMYSVDAFQQAQLSMISATTHRDTTNMFDGMDPSSMPFLKMFKMEDRFVIDSWLMEWEPSVQSFRRHSFTKAIAKFSGSRRVTDLTFYPVRFFADGDQKAIDRLLCQLEERGQTWQKVVSTPPSCWLHEGTAKEMAKQADPDGMVTVEEREKFLDERVMVDYTGYKQFGEVGIMNMLQDMMTSVFASNKKIPEHSILMGAVDEIEGAPDNWPASKPFSKVQARLCPSGLYCCAPRTTTWYFVSVANLKPVKWGKDAIDSLVVEDTTKEILRGLVEQHKKRKLDGVVSDFMPGKGQALVVVLHGPPGVGKTLTAECIAEYTEKPLYSINMGDLSSDKHVLRRLETMFELSVRWDALLLLDEADVVLEKRSYENLHRNAIVSVFLRMLEYYRGILFMTTNRLGTMDIAFQSRVSLAIKFNLLTDDTRRQIWLNFISRLEIVDKEGKGQLLERLDDIKLWQLNGRQIRNVLRMAQVIALSREKRPGAMRYEHVEQVATETLNFQHYFQEEFRESRSQLGDMDNTFRTKKANGRSSNFGRITPAGQWD